MVENFEDGIFLEENIIRDWRKTRRVKVKIIFQKSLVNNWVKIDRGDNGNTSLRNYTL